MLLWDWELAMRMPVWPGVPTARGGGLGRGADLGLPEDSAGRRPRALAWQLKSEKSTEGRQRSPRSTAPTVRKLTSEEDQRRLRNPEVDDSRPRGSE